MEDARPNRQGVAALAVATAAAGSMAAAVFPEPADARSPRETCPADTLCLWANPHFNLPVEWSREHMDQYALDTYDSHPGVGLNNTVDSVWNNTDKWIKLCNNAFCHDNGGGFGGPCLAPGGAMWDLDELPDYAGQNWGDNLSAHFIYFSNPGVPPCYTIVDRQGCSL